MQNCRSLFRPFRNTAYEDGLIPANVLEALASFERSLLTPHSRFDRFLRGERQVLTSSEQQGYQLFKSYGCVSCHQGINMVQPGAI